MKKYKIVENGVKRDDGANIPNTIENRDWVEYQSWLMNGNTPDPMDVPPPMSRDELVRDGILEVWPIEKQVEALVDNARGDAAKITELSNHIESIKSKYEPHITR